MIGTILSHYRIVSKLGRGGMGEVYRARDTTLDRDVALKLLPGEIADDPARRARFEQEAKAVAALSHPNILAIYEFGHDQGRSYAAMELLEGETLRDRLLDGRLPCRKAIELAIQANLYESAFANGPFLICLAAYFVFVIATTVWMLRTFARPAASTT